jgi:hypothetical protein
VRRSQVPPQPAPKSIISVAWPSGITSPLPQNPSGATGQVLAVGAIGSVNVMLTNCVVSAAAGDMSPADAAAKTTNKRMLRRM